MIFDPVEHGNYQLLKKTLLQTQLTFAGQNLCSNIRFRLETYSLIWGDDKRYLASITIQVWRKDEEFKPEKHCLKYLALKRLYNSGGERFSYIVQNEFVCSKNNERSHIPRYIEQGPPYIIHGFENDALKCFSRK